jgi:hypothetical protein
MTLPNIPDAFIQWAYHGRAKLIRRQAQGEQIMPHEIFLGFCRHTPAIVSCGPAGLNASIKGVGFVPKPEYLQETLDAYLQHIAQGWHEGYSEKGLQLLMTLLYGESCQERIDFNRFGTLELARDHTWQNLQVAPQVTLLFYQPPAVSYEVRGRAEIHLEGSPYHRLLNAQHDVYHKPNPERWNERPAYLFTVEEIFDNSVTPQGFGKQILAKQVIGY